MSKVFNKEQQATLKKLIDENNTEDNTKVIQEKKHSALIRRDISKIQNIKRKIKNRDFRTLDNECSRVCSFLFVHYPNIYNKMLKDEIDVKILYSFLDVLEKIEKGERTQHEASYEIGMYLKELYIDKRLESTNSQVTTKTVKPNANKSKLTYREYKEKH